MPLGTFEDVAAQVEGLFPGIAWRKRDPGAWWGVRPDPAYVEAWLHLGMEPRATLVGSLTLKRTDRGTVERAADALGLVALDTQQGEVHRGGRPGWRR